MNDKITYYNKHKKDAFRDGYVEDTSYEKIEDEIYKGYKFFVTKSCFKKATFIRKYFNYIDSKPTKGMSRRKNWCEWADAILSVFEKIDGFFTRKQTFVAGSQSICAIPWAAFGPTQRMVKNNFDCITDISRYYKQYLHGDCLGLQTHFKVNADFIFKLSKRFHGFPLGSPNFWMGVAICLVYDLIHNCGPDCPPLLELYTNDYRINSGFGSDGMGEIEWEELRCKILGVDTNPLSRLPHPKVNYEPIPTKYKIEIMMIDGSFEDLALGEKTELINRPVLALPPAIKDRDFCGPPDPTWKGIPYRTNNYENLSCLPVLGCDRDVFTRMRNGRGLMGFVSGPTDMI